VFSSIDHYGRYAYGSQPSIAVWNLARLAEAMLPLLSEHEDTAVATARAALGGFAPRFEAEWLGGMRRKLGLQSEEDGDAALVQDLLERMKEGQADFTLTFRGLAAAAAGPDGDGAMRTLFTDPGAYDDWAARWRERLAREAMAPDDRAAAMRAVNPLFIPRNHQVEAALAAGIRGDFAPFERLHAVLSRPFDEQPGQEAYSLPPEPSERVLQTFCGT
jgi:uncharacterized protein YdiU (UPF0061 family)